MVREMLNAGKVIEKRVFASDTEIDIVYSVDENLYWDWNDPNERPMLEAITEFGEAGHGRWITIRKTSVRSVERLVLISGDENDA